MRKDPVIALIEHAKNALDRIREQYGKALNAKAIPTSLVIDIKNYMENLRSALDYIAHDIYEAKIHPYRISTGKQEVKRIYFPYGRNENDFKSSLGSSLPELKTISPDLYDIIEEIQSHKTGDNWLCDFCSILNEEKHNTLTPQTKEEKRGLNIEFSGGAGIKMGPGAVIAGSGFIGTGTGGIHLHGDVISGDSPAKRTTGDVKQTVIVWVSFKFGNTNVEVLPLLEKVLGNVKVVSNKVCGNI